jgi:protein subunit release factor B
MCTSKGLGPVVRRSYAPPSFAQPVSPILTSLQNKTNSAVQITHLPTGIVVKSQATRSRSQNHKIAKQILAEKIELLQRGAVSRAGKMIEAKSKRKASASKKSKRKYRALEEAKSGSVATDAAGQLDPELHGEGDGTGQDNQSARGPT